MRTGSIVLLLALIIAMPAFSQTSLGSLGFSVRRTEVLRTETAAGSGDYIPTPEFTYPKAPIPSPLDPRLSLGAHAPERGLFLIEQGQRPTRLHPSARAASWSSSGLYFAFIAPRPGVVAYPDSVYVMRARPLEVVKRLDFNLADYMWSPDGVRLAVAGRVGPEPFAPVLLAIYDVRTGIIKLVDRFPWMQYPPTGEWWIPESNGFSWSPDGKWLAYSQVRVAVGDAGVFEADIVVTNADATVRQRLTHGAWVDDAWPRWVAPDRIRVYRTVLRPTPDNPENLPAKWERTEDVILHLTVPTSTPALPRGGTVLALSAPDVIGPLVVEPRPAYGWCYAFGGFGSKCIIDVGIDWGHCAAPDDTGALGVNGAYPDNESAINGAVAYRMRDWDLPNYLARIIVHTGGTNEFQTGCLTPTQRAQVMNGEIQASDGWYYIARVGLSVHHNSSAKTGANMTWVLMHYQSSGVLANSLLNNVYTAFQSFSALAGCLGTKEVKLLNSKSLGWGFVNERYNHGGPAAISEALFVSNPCQWAAMTNPNPYYPGTAHAGVDLAFADTEGQGLTNGIVACWSTLCGPR